ncbi:cyclic nucleotide-binding domain-containing protein [Pedobacter duraquae]|uniref:Cyclic nucleotide-binding domain-containing protein n=1 Tax=Pedobacter duraquae TaxID=425511 RepID=A0A4R6IBW7_9SPHI|nr:hypothetical protein [Pedobacter duraquae]TDO19314.1 hypothetical protein CLV32_4554 [Pedobacter duraquae]
MEEFIAFIKTIIYIDDLDLQLVLSRCKTRKIAKGKMILKKGQIASQYFFIVSGGVRFFYHFDDQEATTWVTSHPRMGRIRQKNMGNNVSAYDRPDSKLSNLNGRRTLPRIYAPT